MKASMTIISGEALKQTLGDIVTATTEMQAQTAEMQVQNTEMQAQTARLKELADAQRARDNESLWDKMKRVAQIPLYKKAVNGNPEDKTQ